MKVSLIITIKNEQKTISDLLDSIANQTKVPDETIIVDGGSTDATVQIIEAFEKLNIILIQTECNIAKGRNIAIRNSTHDIVAVTDAGCILHENWVERITAFNDKTDVIVGNYKPVIKSLFDACQYSIMGLFKSDTSLKKFVISSRSLAFKKGVWEKLKGYPEWLNFSEDQFFHEQIKRQKFHIIFAKNAVVEWRQRKNLREVFKQFFLYMEGQAIANLYTFRHILRFFSYIVGSFLAIISIRNAFFLVPLFLGFAIYLRAPIKNFINLEKYKINLKTIIFIIFLLIWSDLAKMAGYIAGIIRRISKAPNRKFIEGTNIIFYLF